MELEDKLKTLKNQDGTTIYDHISEVLEKMVENQEEYPLHTFEDYSQEIQRTRANKTQKSKLIRDDPKALKDYYSKLKSHIAKPVQTEEEETTNLGELRNLLKDEAVMRKAGVSISDEETFYLTQSIKKLIKTNSLSKVGFWGKVFTRTKDYFVLEVRGEGGEEEGEITESHEPKGTGVNKERYFVSTDLLNDKGWVELPVITSKQLKQAREISYIFTGDLEHKIITSPIFDGREKHYVD